MTANGAGRHSAFRMLVAACIGNGLEFYNVTIYAFVAVTLSHLFFHVHNPTIAIMLTFGTFGLSYVVRPLGGLFLGAYADRVGRRSAMLLTVILMFVGTLMIAGAPTYRSIGLWAPALILLGRLLQGFALGGEFGSAMAYLLEHAPKDKRPLFVGLQFVSQGVGAVLATAVGFTLSRLSQPQIDSWGWRLPFCAGLLIAPVGVYLSRSLEDRPAEDVKRRHPVRLLFRYYGWRIVIASMSVAVLSANVYLRVFLPTFLAVHRHQTASSTYFMHLLSSGTTSMVILLTARWVRTENVVWWMLAVTVLTLTLLWPLLHMVDVYQTLKSAMLADAVLAALGGLFTAPHGWFMSMLFPREVRAAGVGASYNTGVMLFGGFAPMLYASLVAGNGRLTRTIAYMMAAGVISVCAIAMAPRLLEDGEVVEQHRGRRLIAQPGSAETR